MIARRLSIDPALLVSMFSRPDAWRSVANRLPEDAKVDRVETDVVHHRNETKDCLDGYHFLIEIWITSSVFREDDPMDLPEVQFETVPIDPTVKPINLTREERLAIESKLQALMARPDREIKVCDADGNPI